MNKHFLKSTLYLTLVMLPILLFSLAHGAEKGDKAKPILLKVAYHWPAGSLDSNSFQYFADLVEKDT